MSVKRKAFKRWFKRTGPWPVNEMYNTEGFLHTGFVAGWTACARAMLKSAPLHFSPHQRQPWQKKGRK